MHSALGDITNAVVNPVDHTSSKEAGAAAVTSAS
jgi:hypothetical protein